MPGALPLSPAFLEVQPSSGSLSPLVLSWRQVITLEGWVEIMYYVMDAHSFYNFIYFILLIIVSIRAAGGSPGKLKDPRARGRGEGNLCESPGSPSEPGELGEREQEGQFLNAAQQRVIEGTRQGRLLEASITCDCLHFSFLAFESTPRLLLLSFFLVVPGNTCFL